MDDIISTFTNTSNTPDEPVNGPVGPEELVDDSEQPWHVSAAQKLPGGLVESFDLALSQLIKSTISGDFVKDFNYDIVKDLSKLNVESTNEQQTLPSFSSSTQIVTGPDGEKYFTDGSGLFINVNDVEGNNAFVLPAHDCFSEIRDIIVPEEHSLSGSAVVNVDDNEKLVLEIYLPKGQKAKHINYAYIVDCFTLTGKDVFDVNDICAAIEVDGNLKPTCEYFTASKPVSVELVTTQSSHYTFDRESKLQHSCACPSVKKEKNSLNPPCSWENQKNCSHYSPETWTPMQLSVSSVECADEASDLPIQDLEIQSMRIGFGHMVYRLIDLSTNTVLVESLYDNETKEKTFDIFLDSIQSKGIKEVFSNPMTTEIPEGKVYTQHVASA